MVVIDDDPQSLAWIESALKRPELEIVTATGSDAGLDLIRRHWPQIAVVNLGIPCNSGGDLLASILEIDPAIEVVLMTGAAYSSTSAMAAIDRGACDYLAKPLPMERLRQRIGLLIQEAERREMAQRLDRELSEACRFEGCVGRSPLMRDIFARIARVAPHFRTALIGGLPGTGKELAARALHRLSPVAAERFFACDCGSVSTPIAESELFCSGQSGTLFLNGIDRLPLPVQGKLTKFLKNSTQHKTTLRVIASTSRDLDAMVRERSFRADLLQRLSGIEIQLPSLQRRMEDLPLLIQHFVTESASQNSKRVLGVTQRAELALYAHNWLGNIRELAQVIGHAALATNSNRIDIQHLPAAFQSPVTGTDGVELVSADEIQYLHARRVHDFFKGDKTRTAETLHVSRATLYRLLAHSRSMDS
jgi:DNA-binding NtrC family response regulator